MATTVVIVFIILVIAMTIVSRRWNNGGGYDNPTDALLPPTIKEQKWYNLLKI